MLNDQNFIEQLLDHLAGENIQSVIIEGGAYTLTKFIEGNWWDEARIFVAKALWEEG